MNEDIKQGAAQMAKGIKAEAKDFSDKAKVKFEELKAKVDSDNDGKIEASEVKDALTKEAKEGFDKLKNLVTDEKISLKTREELADVVNKIKPVFDAKKMEAEIAKEKVEAEIEHRKEVEALKEEVLGD